MQPHGGNDKTHLLRVLTAENHNAVDQLAAAVFIHQGDEAVAHLHFNGLYSQQGVDIADILVVIRGAGRGLRGLRLGRLRHRGLLCLDPLHPAIEEKTADQQGAAYHGKGEVRCIRQHRQKDHCAARHHDGHRLGAELGPHVLAQAPLRHAAGHDHARGGGDHQGRDLADQAVAHRELGIGGEHRGKVHAAHHHTDDDTANQVDQRQDDGHGGIALDDLGSTIHGAVEVRLALNLLAAHPCLLVVDHPGVQVGVNRHLLAGHGVQRKTRRHFRDTLRTLGNDDQLHQYDDDEDNKPNDYIARRNQLTESSDHLTCGVLALDRAVAQNQAGGGDVHTQSKQGCDQQQRRKNGEFQRFGDAHGDDQDDDRERDVDDKKDVQQCPGNGNDHKQHDHDHKQGNRIIL